MRSSLKLHPLALTAAVGLAVSALAGGAQAEEVETEAVAVTATALKIDTSLEETPQSVSVISGRQLDAQVATKIDDALRYTSSFWNPFGADYDTNWIRMRGFEMTQAVDGHVQFEEGYFGTAIEPFGLEAVEVVKGPSSALFGNSQPGGVINMVTKRPTKTPLHKVFISGGSSKHLAGGLDVSDSLDETGSKRFRIVAAGSRTDSVLDGVDGWRAYLAPSFTIDVSPATSLTLRASYLKDRKVNNSAFFSVYGTYFPVNGRRVSRSVNYGDPDHDRFDKDQTTIGWDFTHAFNDEWRYRASFSYKHDDFFLRNTAAYNAFDASWAVIPTKLQRYSLINDGTTDSIVFDNNVTGEFSTGSFDNIVQLGFDYGRYRNKFKGNGVSGTAVGGLIDIFNPTYGGLPGDDEIALFDNDIKKRQLGVYAQGQTTWNEMILARAGVRYDRVKIDNHCEDPTALASEQSLNEHQMSWNAGLMYLSPIGVSPYVNYSESFYATASLVSDSNWKRVLSKPVESSQWEFGVKFTPDWLDGFVNVAYYDLKQKNAITQQTFGSVLSTVQTPEKETRGVEVELHAAVTRHATVDATYTYIDATYGGDGARADYMPRHAATGWVVYDFAGLGVSGLEIGTGLRYLGSSVNTATGDRVGDVTLWDMTAAWAFADGWKVNGIITNVTDKKYVAGAYNNIAYYGEGRVMKATLTYSW